MKTWCRKTNLILVINAVKASAGSANAGERDGNTAYGGAADNHLPQARFTQR
jgi:hypothetical protein